MKNILYTALGALMLASCQKEANDLPQMGNYPEDGVVRIATQLNAPITRAAGTTDYTGTDLSLSIEPQNGNSTYTYTNIQWTTTDNGTTWTTASQMLWEGANKVVDIYAYAPYVDLGESGVITAVPFSVAADQTGGTVSSDLVGFTQTNFNPYNQLNVKQAVDITFDHILSKLTLTLSFGDQFDGENVTVSSVKLVGTNTAVSYHAKDKTVTAATPVVVAPISMQSLGSNQYTAILAPQIVAAGAAMIDVTLSNGSTYRYTAAAGGHTFARGTAYTMNLKIGKDKITIDGNVTVSEWGTDTDNPFEGGGEAEKVPFIIGYFSGELIEVNEAGELTTDGGYWRYETKLIVAEEDASTVGMQWATGNETTNVTDIWNGKGNTLALYNLNDETTTYPAATAAIEANSGTITDITDDNYIWYLPAQNQLMAMWVTNEALCNSLATVIYWSATEGTTGGAWCVAFDGGSTGTYDETNYGRVRLVRDIK